MDIEVEEYIYTSKETLKEIKREFKTQTILIIISVILALGLAVISFKCKIDEIILLRENESLERIVESQRSMISDLEENLRELYKNKIGGNE